MESCCFEYVIDDGSYKEGDIRLVKGSYNWEGRVEIYWSGTWGAISDSSWTSADATVVCKQLQHSPNGDFTLYSCLLQKHIQCCILAY